MRKARSRLAAQAAAAGYPPALLTQIATAVLPGYQPADRLTTPELQVVSDAVEVTAQAGYDPAALAVVLAEYPARHGDRWREVLWQHTLSLAALRHAHPERYGVSPCATDPDRPARRPRSESAD